jgi:PAS domain S-box-containing protein
VYLFEYLNINQPNHNNVIATETEVRRETQMGVLVFRHLPGFAGFLLKNHLVEYIKEQLRLSKELDLPLLRQLSHIPEDQLLEISIPSHSEFLTSTIENRLKAHIDASSERWLNDQLGIIGRDQVEAEDITLANFIRNKAMYKFLPLYTTDTKELIALVEEINAVSTYSETSSTNTFIQILQDRINQRELQLLEAQELVNMGSYILDLSTDKLIVTPQYRKIFEIEGEVDRTALMKGIHPADATMLKEAREKAISENGVYECEYRHIVNGKEKIIWAQGNVMEAENRKIMKGTVIDVTDRHYMIQRLLRGEALYKQAQALAHLGNWVWHLETNKIEWSDELYRIYEMEEGSEVSFESLAELNHPEDDALVKSAMRAAIETRQPYDFVYRIVFSGGRTKILQARGEVKVDEDGKVFKLLGTLQDITEKQTLLEKLQESDKLFKQAQSISHVGNWTWDIKENRIRWTDELFRIYGLEPVSEISYEQYQSLLHPSDKHILNDAVAGCLATHEPYEVLHTIQRPDGAIRQVIGQGQVELNERGEPVRMLGTSQDVTERQKLIEQLQYNERLYKEAQALAHLGNFSHDIQTGAITWTDELYRIYGMEPQSETITFEKVLSFIHPEDKEHAMKEITGTLNSRKPYDSIYRIVLKNGSVKVVHRQAEFDPASNFNLMYGTVQDITKEWLAEAEIREKSEFIQKIANTTPSLIASYNINTGKYTYINSAFEKILGYPAQKVLDEGIPFMLDIIHPDDLQPIMEKNGKALEEANLRGKTGDTEDIVEFKYRMRHIDGEYRWFHTFGTVFDRDEHGKVIHVLNVSVDITDQEEAEQELYQKNLQLQQSNASLEEYAYVASHDLKEPLRKIATFGDRLLSSQSERLSDEGKMHLEKIISSSRRMQAMISDLLAVSTITGERSFEPYSLQSVLNDVVQTLEHKMEEKKAVIISDDLPIVKIVPSQFRQLFQNLISNSLKFVKEGTIPRIEIRHKYLPPADVQQHELAIAKKYLALTFTDNGIGFDNQFANKIFTIFQRLHGRTEFEGTGIGLAICKKVAENHGGAVVADSKPGEGATFTIIVPV